MLSVRVSGRSLLRGKARGAELVLIGTLLLVLPQIATPGIQGVDHLLETEITDEETEVMCVCVGVCLALAGFIPNRAHPVGKFCH